MHSIRILGAGSIGNHLANAARSFGWRVTLTDIDPAALERTRTSIYPQRYGTWDEEIVLKDSRAAMNEPADAGLLACRESQRCAAISNIFPTKVPAINRGMGSLPQTRGTSGQRVRNTDQSL